MDLQKENHLLEQFEKTKTFKRFFSTLLRFDEELDCFIATEKWRDKEAELLTAAWWMFAEVATAQAVQEWILVEDQMPPVNETVLVCWDYAPDIEPDKEYTTIDENLDEYWPNCQDEPPTHWMPLPKVIKAQEPTND